jgi:hypothetical protein
MIGVACFIVVWICKPRDGRREAHASGELERKTVGIYLITYTLFLIISSSRFASEPINDRLLAPIFPLVIFMAFTTIEGISYWLYSALHRWKPITVTITILLFFFLLYPAMRTFFMISDWKVEGAGENFYGRSYYGQKAWQESPVIQWLKHHSLQGRIYSNEPIPLYILTGIVAGWSPGKEYVPQFRNELILQNNDCFLIWFDDNLNGQKRLLVRESEVYPLAKLREMFRLNEIITFSDGCVYQFVNPEKKLDGSNKT